MALQASETCKHALTCADANHIPIAPIMVQKDYAMRSALVYCRLSLPAVTGRCMWQYVLTRVMCSDWVGVICAGMLYTSFQEQKEFSKSMDLLLNELRSQHRDVAKVRHLPP